MQEIKVYVAFDGDHIGRKVGQASLHDQPEELRRLSQAIEKGNEVWKAWALAAGGSVLSLGGDEGRIEIPASHLEELPKLRQQYAEAVGSSVSVGVGQKLSEAEKALVVAKIRGGNQVVLFTPEIEQEMDKNLAPKPESEVDKLAQSYGPKSGSSGEVDKLAQAYTKSEAPAMLPDAKPFVPEALPSPWTPEGLHPDLHPIAYLESNYGRNLNHIKSFAGPMHTPTGALGMKPAQALKEYKHNPQLRAEFPNLDGHEGTFVRMLERSHNFYNAVASHLWDRTKRALGNHTHRAAYAWRYDFDKARNTRDSVILQDPYVHKFLSLTKGMKEIMSLYKHEMDFLPSNRLSKGYEPADASVLEEESNPASAGGGVSPAQPSGSQSHEDSSSGGFNGAPEHSEGEAAANYFAQNAPGSPEATHNPSDVESMMHQSASETHDQDHQEVLDQKERQDGEDHKEDLKEQIVKVLQQFKQQAPVIEQLKEQAPDLYQSITQVMQAFVALAQEVVGGDDASQQDDSSEDAEGSESSESDSPPKEASSDDGKEESSDTKKHERLVLLKEKLAKIESLISKAGDEPCKVCKGTGKKRQGYDKRNDKIKEVPCKACNGTGAASMEKGALPTGAPKPPPTHHHVNLPVGSNLNPEGKVKVQHMEQGVTGKKDIKAKTGWIQARAGQVLSNDGHSISSRNAGGK